MNLKSLNFGLWKQRYQQIPEAVRSVAILAILLVFIVVVKEFTKKKEMTTKGINIDSSIDTVIPAGFVLVPVEISNIDSIGPLIGTQAVVDLYKFNEKGVATKVAKRVKVLRAPYNPNVYAVLVREEETDLLMRHQGAYYAAIQNENVKSSGVTRPAGKSSKISISYSP
ncbi:MAG: hypothetical protein V4736_03225 [Bdellovibrionota bacterium]